MQFFALDNSTIVFAEEALKGKTYVCQECNNLLGIKQDPYLKKYFFHLHTTPKCHQSHKDQTHLAIQKALLNLLPYGKLEYYFPTIHRIADIVCLKQKLVFEIQCSPISLREVEERIKGYESLGLTTIWILHERHFNQKNLSPAEHYLRRRICYFTSINPSGTGIFYDQLEFFKSYHRLYKGPPLILENLLPKPIHQIPKTFPKILKEKLRQTPLYLSGDLTTLLLKRVDSNWAQILEKTYIQKPSFFIRLLAYSKDFFLYLLRMNASQDYSSSVHKPVARQNREEPLNTNQNRPLL